MDAPAELLHVDVGNFDMHRKVVIVNIITEL
jgi:hypothetical protein